MQSMYRPTPWLRYKRYSDQVKLEARLIIRDGKKMMQVKQPKTGNFTCPHCSKVISQGNGHLIADILLDPVTFHELHKPI